MKQCMHKIETVKVPQGNAFRLLLPFKTARWENNELVPDNIDIRYLEDVVITIDGEVWTDYEMDDRGPIVQIGAEDFNELGAYNAVIEATYAGVAIRGAYYECFTRVEWSFESNVELHLPDSPLVAETSYVYIGITDDQELEALKQQYRNAIAACETARLQYEAAKEAYDEKAEALDDVAKETTSQAILTAVGNIHIDTSDLAKEQTLTAGIQAIIQDLAPKATKTQLDNATAQIIEAISHIDIDTSTLAKEATLTAVQQAVLTALSPKATTSDVNNAKQAILDALGQIQPDDPYSRALAAFFNITAEYDPDYTPLTAAEMIAIARDCQYNVMGTDWPIPTWLPTGVTEAQVESAAEGLGIPYHEPTQTA